MYNKKLECLCVPPASNATVPFQRATDRSLNGSRHHASNCLTRMIKSHPFRQFQRCVPMHYMKSQCQSFLTIFLDDSLRVIVRLTEQSHHSRPRTTLTKTEESSYNIDLLCIFRYGQKASKDTPRNFETRKPKTRPYICQHYLGRNEHDAVAYIEVCREAISVD